MSHVSLASSLREFSEEDQQAAYEQVCAHTGDKQAPWGCRLWTGPTTKTGVPIVRVGGREVSVRQVQLFCYSPTDASAVGAPRCGNASCVTVHHLPRRTSDPDPSLLDALDWTRLLAEISRLTKPVDDTNGCVSWSGTICPRNGGAIIQYNGIRCPVNCLLQFYFNGAGASDGKLITTCRTLHCFNPDHVIRSGDTDRLNKLKLQEMLANTDKDEETGCLLWRGLVDRDGYGRTFHMRANWKTHRLVWTLLRGPIPEGKMVRHDQGPKRCSKRCMNIDHLAIGTALDNSMDYRRVRLGQQGETAADGSTEHLQKLKVRNAARRQQVSQRKQTGFSRAEYERCWKSIQKRAAHNEETGCMTLSADRRRYPFVTIAGVPRLAHRVVYEFKHNDCVMLAGREIIIRHLCANKLCVAPDHLRGGSARDNAVDAIKDGAGRRSKLLLHVKNIRRLHRNGMTVGQLAKRYYVANSRISAIIDGKVFSWMSDDEGSGDDAASGEDDPDGADTSTDDDDVETDSSADEKDDVPAVSKSAIKRKASPMAAPPPTKRSAAEIKDAGQLDLVHQPLSVAPTAVVGIVPVLPLPPIAEQQMPHPDTKLQLAERYLQLMERAMTMANGDAKLMERLLQPIERLTALIV